MKDIKYEKLNIKHKTLNIRNRAKRLLLQNKPYNKHEMMNIDRLCSDPKLYESDCAFNYCYMLAVCSERDTHVVGNLCF